MGLIYEVIHDNLQIIATNCSKFLQDYFIMNIFDIFAKELPAFQDHLHYIFEVKEIVTVDEKTKLLPADLI